jgi:type III pantothenate kinase
MDMNVSLVIDIGNTSTSVGYYAAGEVEAVGRCASRFADAEVVKHLATKRPVTSVVIASVVPDVNDKWMRALLAAGLPEPLFVRHDLKLGVAIDYSRPERIGPDRLANAVAASRLFGIPSVVCDFGTALTFDVLEAGRGYTGGVICPGLPLMFDYLAEKTALLPHVEPAKTEHVVGRNTEEAMQIGARIGYRGMVREILNALREELCEPQLNVVCTGGYAAWIFEEWEVAATVDPFLTLKGVGIIGELNAR